MVPIWQNRTIAIGVAVLSIAPATNAQDRGGAAAIIPDLMRAVEDHHPQLKALKAELRGTNEVIHQIESSYRPNVFLESNVSTSQRDATLQAGGEFDQTIEPQAVSLRVTQTLYNGGRRGIERYAARLQIETAQAQYAVAADQIKLALLSDYIALSSVQTQVEVLQETVALLRDLLGATMARDRFGDSSAIEVAQVQGRLASAQADLAIARGQRIILSARIESATGRQALNASLPALSFDPLEYRLEDVQRRIRGRNPGLRASDLQTKSARVQFISESRSGGPTIALNASATKSQNSSPTIDRDDQLTVGLRLTMPLYSGGQRRSSKRRAYANVKASELSRMEQARQLDLAILQIWHGLIAQENMRLAQETNLKAASLAQDGIIEAQKAGFASASDILDTVQQVLAAQLAVSRAEHDAAHSRLLLLFYLGDLDHALSPTMDSPRLKISKVDHEK
ncbi:MAG: TolC family protein [Pseudomonadota bacterium]